MTGRCWGLVASVKHGPLERPYAGADNEPGRILTVPSVVNLMTARDVYLVSFDPSTLRVNVVLDDWHRQIPLAMWRAYMESARVAVSYRGEYNP